jgi:hypothetical protein
MLGACEVLLGRSATVERDERAGAALCGQEQDEERRVGSGNDPPKAAVGDVGSDGIEGRRFHGRDLGSSSFFPSARTMAPMSLLCGSTNSTALCSVGGASL